MLEIDTLTIIACCIVLFCTISACIFNPFFKRVRTNLTERENFEDEGISIIFTSHDQAKVLANHLPLFLDQNFDKKFQIIVVAERGDTQTEDVLKRLKAEWGDKLYYTFIPDSSRYMSRKKLQITLGVKAALYNWVLLVDPTNRPQSRNWLNAISQYCTHKNNLVMGVTMYDEETSNYRRFEHILRSCDFMKRASKLAFSTNMHFVGFKKDEFLAQEGFRGSLQLIRGEYDFLINKYAKKDGTFIACEPECILIEDKPTKKTWKNLHLYDLASKAIIDRAIRPRLWENTCNALLHTALWINIVALVYSILKENYILLGIAVFCIALLFSIRWITAGKAVHQFDSNISTFKMPFYELSFIWRNLDHKWQYLRADKNDFTSHKL